jgi:hypothetical protein
VLDEFGADGGLLVGMEILTAKPIHDARFAHSTVPLHDDRRNARHKQQHPSSKLTECRDIMYNEIKINKLNDAVHGNIVRFR